jgi:hypothetical protein
LFFNMKICFLLLLKHPQNLVSLHALFVAGIVKAKSPHSDPQVVFDSTMSLTSWDPNRDKPPPPPPPPLPPPSLLDPLAELRRRRAQKATSTPASRAPSRKPISSGKSNSSSINTPNASSSQTLGAESTSRGPDCVPYWNSHVADWSEK